MSKNEIAKYKSAFVARTKEIQKTSEESLDVLVRAGIHTKNGSLKKAYRATTKK